MDWWPLHHSKLVAVCAAATVAASHWQQTIVDHYSYSASHSALASAGDSFLGNAGSRATATDAALAAAVEEGTNLFLDQVCSAALLLDGTT